MLLLNIGIARLFAAEKSGHLFFIANNLSLIILIVSLSLESGSTYYIASGKIDASQMGLFSVIWAVVASIIAIAVWYFILYHKRISYISDPGFILASFFFILGSLFISYFSGLFYAGKQFSKPNKVLFSLNLVLLLVLIFCRQNLFIKSNFLEIYFSFFFLQGLFLLILFFNIKWTARKVTLIAPGLIKQVARYSLTALLANMIYFLLNRIDYWFVEYYCSGKDLGNYIQASKLMQMQLILPSILGSTLFTFFSSGEKDKNLIQMTTSIRILLWVNIIISMLLICSGWFIFPLLFGSSFDKMYGLFVLMIPGILSVTIHYPLSSMFSASRRIHINIRGILLGLIVVCVGDLVALPRFGVFAAPVVSSAGFLTFLAYAIYMGRKDNMIAWNDILLIRKSDLNRIRMAIRSRERSDNEDLLPQNMIP